MIDSKEKPPTEAIGGSQREDENHENNRSISKISAIVKYWCQERIACEYESGKLVPWQRFCLDCEEKNFCRTYQAKDNDSEWHVVLTAPPPLPYRIFYLYHNFEEEKIGGAALEKAFEFVLDIDGEQIGEEANYMSPSITLAFSAQDIGSNRAISLSRAIASEVEGIINQRVAEKMLDKISTMLFVKS